MTWRNMSFSNDYECDSWDAATITPDPRHQSLSHRAATCPGLTACCGSWHSMINSLCFVLQSLRVSDDIRRRQDTAPTFERYMELGPYDIDAWDSIERPEESRWLEVDRLPISKWSLLHGGRCWTYFHDFYADKAINWVRDTEQWRFTDVPGTR